MVEAGRVVGDAMSGQCVKASPEIARCLTPGGSRVEKRPVSRLIKSTSALLKIHPCQLFSKHIGRWRHAVGVIGWRIDSATMTTGERNERHGNRRAA